MKAVTQITKAYSIQNEARRIFEEKLGKQRTARTLLEVQRAY
jgi:hypothetical protein